MPSGTRSRPRSGILEDAAGARRVERLRALAERERLRAPSRAAPPDRRATTRKHRRQQHLAGVAAGGCDRSRTPSPIAVDVVGHARRATPAARRSTRSPISRPPKCALPKMAPPTVPGVPAHASSPRAPCVIVQRTSPLIVTAASARTLIVVVRLHLPAARPDHQPANPRVAIPARSIRRRASSPARPRRAPAPARVDDLVARARFDQPVRRPADAERRERRAAARARACARRRTPTSSAGSKVRHARRGLDRHQRTLLRDQRGQRFGRRARRRTRSSRPGPSWPARPMSAAITVAIFG